MLFFQSVAQVGLIKLFVLLVLFLPQTLAASPPGYIPLHVAILRKDLDMVNLLISAGSDLNKQVSFPSL